MRGGSLVVEIRIVDRQWGMGLDVGCTGLGWLVGYLKLHALQGDTEHRTMHSLWTIEQAHMRQ